MNSKFVKNGKTKKSTIEYTNDCTQDILSAVYYTRCIDFSNMEPGTTIPLPLVLDGKHYKDISVQYLGKENIETDFGTFRTIKFSPTLLEGEFFEDGDEMIIWATDDKNRIPLKITSPLTVGEIKAFLTSVSGLKYPLDSKIKSKS